VNLYYFYCSLSTKYRLALGIGTLLALLTPVVIIVPLLLFNSRSNSFVGRTSGSGRFYFNDIINVDKYPFIFSLD
jgi:hypothetical protein